MAITPLNYDDIEDFRYNPFSGEFTPKLIGYGGNPAEVRQIPSSSPYWIKLYESPLEDTPSKTRIIRNDTSITLTEVSKTTIPSTNQYRVNYDELGNGIVDFHPSLSGVEVSISYYGLGHLFQKISLDTRVPDTGNTTIAGNKTLTGNNAFSGDNDFQAIECTTIKLNDDWSAVRVGLSHGSISPTSFGNFSFGASSLDNNGDISGSTIIIPREGIYGVHIHRFPYYHTGTDYFRIFLNGSPANTFMHWEVLKLNASDSLAFQIFNSSGGTKSPLSDYTLRFQQLSNWLK